ncbi:MAG: hypothetical protein LQ345_003474 [Seirophora villosa]|nr:MAG: hypothetical protein LQ345_003474 [Seirophora villosa]
MKRHALSTISEKSSPYTMSGTSPIPMMPSLISLPHDYGKTVPSRGRSTSPIRLRPSLEQLRRAPSRTFVPLAIPVDIIDFPQIPHPRIALDIRVSAPIFMGGATVEGAVELTIDGGSGTSRARRKPGVLSIDRITVALVGIEQSGARQHMFTCLMTDLIDEAHPPPTGMARPNQPASDRLWVVMPSKTTLPFRLALPVMLGPPPFRSKKNNITYMVSVLAEAKVDGERIYVRKSEQVMVLTVHDPEKALVNLSNPLVVTDEMQSSHRGSLETVTLTAGVHRQTWISGYPLFVDVRVQNRSSKAVRRIEVQLERSIFIYAYAAPSVDRGLGDTLRLPDKCEKDIICNAACPGWQVAGGSQDLKTCGLFVPSGLVSVDAGRFFGVRFFLNVRVRVSFAKHLMVQLPITIIHPNSIDIPPNSLAQVAATIEHKHRHRSSSSPDPSYHYRPGQAFLAARRQSIEQVARQTLSHEDMNAIARVLDDSSGNTNKSSIPQPRRRASISHVSATVNTDPPIRYRNSRFLEGTHSFRRASSPQRLSTRLLASDNATPPRRPAPPIPERRSHAQRSSLDEQASRQWLLGSQHPPRARSSLEENSRRRGPRLQRSTSGLKFSSSEEEEEEEDGQVGGMQVRGF